ncbi:MAG: helix-turn-helix protein [Mucilaginibacter sp.]|nr:helix-turn-helix protein [Mucilaginibacter sp.]
MTSEPQAEILNKFGRHLQAIRKRKKLSYRKIALNCDVDYSDISKIEKGERNPTLLTVVELAKGLGVPLKELMEF